MIKAWIDCNPPKTTGQAAARIMTRRGGTMFVGKCASGKGKAAQDDLMTLLMPHRPSSPLRGAVKLVVTWRYPWRKSEPKRNRALGVMPCTTRPDADNIVKMLLDCMTRLAYWTDDGQVAALTVMKQWGDGPGIGIVVTEMGQCESGNV
jgi:Holliday junction resolvase RusA-like endonuclease